MLLLSEISQVPEARACSISIREASLLKTLPVMIISLAYMGLAASPPEFKSSNMTGISNPVTIVCPTLLKFAMVMSDEVPLGPLAPVSALES